MGWLLLKFLSIDEWKEGMSVWEGKTVRAPMPDGRRGSNRLAGKHKFLY